MIINSEVENKKLEKDLNKCVDDIDENLSVFDAIVNSVIVDKELPKILLSLRKEIFDYIDSNNYVNISDEIILIDKVVNKTYTDFRDMLLTGTYSNVSGLDKMDNKYFLDLIYGALNQIRDIINKKNIDNNSLRDDIRVTYLKKELENLVMKMKMNGIISYDVSIYKINELILYIANNYYQLHFSIVEPLFIDSVKNIDNISYGKYDMEMSKLSVYTSVNNIGNNMYAFLDEDGEDKLKEIKNIIKNISSLDKLTNIGTVLEYLENISKQFIRYEYPSVDIWKKMILELLSIVIDLMNRLSRNNNKDELEEIKELYFNLKKKYFEMIFIGNSKGLIDLKKTERENLILVRK